jgi:hypothetical protein
MPEILNAPSLEVAHKIADDCLLLAGVGTRASPPHQNYHAQADAIRAGMAAAAASITIRTESVPVTKNSKSGN